MVRWSLPDCPFRAEVDQVGAGWGHQYQAGDAVAMCIECRPLLPTGATRTLRRPPLRDDGSIRWSNKPGMSRHLEVDHEVDAQGEGTTGGPRPSNGAVPSLPPSTSPDAAQRRSLEERPSPLQRTNGGVAQSPSAPGSMGIRLRATVHDQQSGNGGLADTLPHPSCGASGLRRKP